MHWLKRDLFKKMFLRILNLWHTVHIQIFTLVCLILWVFYYKYPSYKCFSPWFLSSQGTYNRNILKKSKRVLIIGKGTFNCPLSQFTFVSCNLKKLWCHNGLFLIEFQIKQWKFIFLCFKVNGITDLVLYYTFRKDREFWMFIG